MKPLTREELRALSSCITALSYQIRSDEQVDAEKLKLQKARIAMRKVAKLRKWQREGLV